MMDRVKALFAVVDHNLATINGSMDYTRITDSIITLANTVHNQPNDIDWSIGEFGEFCLDDLFVGAYWHYSEWHSGQWSKEYAALSALGQVFNPNMSMPEPENSAYILLNDLAQTEGIL